MCVCVYVYVPVNCDIVFGAVHDIDHKAIAILDLEGRPGEHPIYRDDIVGVAQPLHRGFLDLNQTKPKQMS